MMKRLSPQGALSPPNFSMASPHLTGSPSRVLVAEDDPEMRRLFAGALRRDGYQVIEVESGFALFEAVRMAHAEPGSVDLLVSDIRMPGFTGLEIAQTIRRWGWSIPVLLVTAFGDEETLNRAVSGGATMVISKPLDLEDLRIAVRHLLESRSRVEPAE